MDLTIETVETVFEENNDIFGTEVVFKEMDENVPTLGGCCCCCTCAASTQ